MGFVFHPEVMWSTAPLLAEGLAMTVRIAVRGLALGMALGVVTGLINTSRSVVLRIPAAIYIGAIRGTPLIVQVMFLYFGLPLALGIRISPVVAGVAAIGVNSGAYIAEIVRGAIISIDRGQTEAARSTGLNSLQTMRHVIWPQAFLRMIPPLGNQFIISIKDTSLLVVIGVAELTRRGQEIIAINFRAFEVWLTVALAYLCLTLTLSRILRILERRLAARGSRTPRTDAGPRRPR
jgi:glutamine transport system permease protein